jgi:hypothetical protein
MNQQLGFKVRVRPVHLVALFGAGSLVMSGSCDDVQEVIDAVLCDNDEECVSGCDTICLGDPVLSSSCNEADGICVCECDTGGGAGGTGGINTECVDGEVVVEPYPTSTQCDPMDSSAPCDSSCESDCVANGFPLGSMGSTCTDTAFGSICECDCAYCRPN